MNEFLNKGFTPTGRLISKAKPQLQNLIPSVSPEYLRLTEAFRPRMLITDYSKLETRVRASSR